MGSGPGEFPHELTDRWLGKRLFDDGTTNPVHDKPPSVCKEEELGTECLTLTSEVIRVKEGGMFAVVRLSTA